MLLLQQEQDENVEQGLLNSLLEAVLAMQMDQ